MFQLCRVPLLRARSFFSEVRMGCGSFVYHLLKSTYFSLGRPRQSCWEHCVALVAIFFFLTSRQKPRCTTTVAEACNSLGRKPPALP